MVSCGMFDFVVVYYSLLTIANRSSQALVSSKLFKQAGTISSRFKIRISRFVVPSLRYLIRTTVELEAVFCA